MRLFDFDRSVAKHHIEQFGSNFDIAPLTGTDVQGRLHCFHIQPGGIIGRHVTVVEQLFCVVSGEGWVSGSDDVRTPIRAWQAALWSSGEDHAAGTDSGLVAMVLEGNFSVIASPQPSSDPQPRGAS